MIRYIDKIKRGDSSYYDITVSYNDENDNSYTATKMTYTLEKGKEWKKVNL